jgi:hypothetical protein
MGQVRGRATPGSRGARRPGRSRASPGRRTPGSWSGTRSPWAGATSGVITGELHLLLNWKTGRLVLVSSLRTCVRHVGATPTPVWPEVERKRSRLYLAGSGDGLDRGDAAAAFSYTIGSVTTRILLPQNGQVGNVTTQTSWSLPLLVVGGDCCIMMRCGATRCGYRLGGLMRSSSASAHICCINKE